MATTKCAKCRTEVDTLAVFPGGNCLKCYEQTDEPEHAPLGGIAFRCEPWELFNSAASIWGMATQSEPDLACQLEATAEWYEGMARTLQDVRGLPDVLVAF